MLHLSIPLKEHDVADLDGEDEFEEETTAIEESRLAEKKMAEESNV